MLENIHTLISASWINNLFNSIDQSSVAAFVKDSELLIPWAGAFHLLSLGLMGGAIILADLKNIGPGLTSVSSQDVNTAMRPWLWSALVVLVISGALLALSQMTRLLYSPPYWMKMAALISALIFTFGVRDNVVRQNGHYSKSSIALGIASLGLFAVSFAILSSLLAKTAMAVLIAVLTALYVASGRKAEAEPNGVRAASAITIGLWFTTALSGRWIAFW